MLVLRFMVGLQAHSVRLGTLARRRPLAGSKQGGCWAQARALSQCPRQGGFLCAAASIYPYVAVCVSGAVGERTVGAIAVALLSPLEWCHAILVPTTVRVFTTLLYAGPSGLLDSFQLEAISQEPITSKGNGLVVNRHRDGH
jgi:hypothetical protein